MKLVHDETGTAAIEAALILPFYIALIFAIIELGNIYWAYNTIQYAADEAARCGAVKSNCDITATVTQSAAGVFRNGEDRITFDTDAICGNYTGTQVTIIHQVSSLTGYFPDVMPAPFHQIAVQSCYPKPT